MLPESVAPMHPTRRTPRITSHPDGVHAIDAEYLRPGAAAVHLIVQDGRAAFVDPATNNSVPCLLSALEQLGIAPASVDYLFLTHIHLDHAGGAGLLLRSLPNARVVLHPRGVAHMIDPSRLMSASRAVYGEERFAHLYGDILPIPAERIVAVADGEHCRLAGREFELLHTPGHAIHHYVIVDPAHACVFAGDTFGVSYRELDTAAGPFIAPATTPPHFDPVQAAQSIQRIMSYGPASIYLMHYSRVTGLPRLSALLLRQLDEYVAIAERHEHAAAPYEAIRSDLLTLWLELLRAEGSRVPPAEVVQVLGLDADLNAQGLVAWLERRQRNKLSG
ncbi:MAG: MBL fold metallo-hydrolase [Sinobacteraceae bacterium]|nr:MBL fold metallo-hydrolase [Nevskiaceae bacterium]